MLTTFVQFVDIFFCPLYLFCMYDLYVNILYLQSNVALESTLNHLTDKRQIQIKMLLFQLILWAAFFMYLFRKWENAVEVSE